METLTRSAEEVKKDLFEITRCIYGNWMSQVTFVFAELGVADQLADGPKTMEELAEAKQVNAG